MGLEIQPLIDWLSQGGTLNNVGAVMGLGALVRIFLLPVVVFLAGRMKLTLVEDHKRKAACVLCIGIAFGLNMIAVEPLTSAAVLALGISSGMTAVGMHQMTTRKPE